MPTFQRHSRGSSLALAVASAIVVLHCANSTFSGSTSPPVTNRDASANNLAGGSGNGGTTAGGNGGATAGGNGSVTPTGGNGAPNLNGGNAVASATVSVPVGNTQRVPNLNTAMVTKCVSHNTQIATVTADCKVTGVTTGVDQVTATLSNGAQVQVAVTVTPNLSTDGASTSAQGGISADGGMTSTNGTVGGLTSTDGIITAAVGFLCLGGPLCHVSFLLKTQDDANTCMQIANNAPCDNDPNCGNTAMLQVCNCSCADPNGLTFDDATSCKRSNPLQPGAHPRLTECQ